ncbi:exopolysaccharide biosynthesis protein [Zavarzinia aquatilis]|uniref:Exopolysaccharide biosynthesis protein n=1 Tax=Zavarzinia aquatilis TaxID=2211142 RepID=A0A317EGQ6_9PROT|nr:exopolysaccharide biosynthesis protein [Zavarzinia aquatilis]PWR25494.1 exopolysaccharide biosynthesis protein [Zavarzinia aquatilis]
MKKPGTGVFREPSAAETLVVMAFGWPEERISIGAIVDMLAERGFGLLILLLALPTCLPIAPPGLSAIAGFPIAVIALQMVAGLPRPWLPKRVLARSLAAEDLRKVVRGGLPVIERVEKVLKPRLSVLTGPFAERMVGLLIALLGLMLASPIPFTNIPISFAILFLALGLIEQDGLMTSIGIAGGIAAIGFLVYMTVLSWDALSGWLGGAI